MRLVDVLAEDQTLKDLDNDLALAFTRGDKGRLPLLLPLVLPSSSGRQPSLAWLGLGMLTASERQLIEFALNHLVSTEGESFEWQQLFSLATSGAVAPTLPFGTFAAVLDSIIRCNRSLFERTANGCRALIGLHSLEQHSLSSLGLEVSKMVPTIRHGRSLDDQHFLYSLAWHPHEKRFRKEFYRTWTVLEDGVRRYLSASYLVHKAYHEVGPDLGTAKAVVSATPSAGLLGRELAAILGIAFYEATSIYDITRKPWLPFLVGPALVVDDVIDTGTLSMQLISHLKDSCQCSCICVLTLLENADAREQRVALPCPLVYGASVRLGIPSPSQIEKAIQTDAYFEVDPHTLEPVPARASEPESLPREKHFEAVELDRLASLANDGGLTFGHFVTGDHHYRIYFSLPDALASDSAQRLLLDWVGAQLSEFVKETRAKRLSIVYPYYSTIYRLVSRLRLATADFIPTETRVDFIIAKPRQLTGDRRGYQLPRSTESSSIDYRHVVFLDDGIATGGTLAATIDELLLTKAVAIRALILFDRIGQQPRRHLRSIQRYRTRTGTQLSFSLRSFVSPNLRTQYENTCLDCAIVRDLSEKCGNHPGFLGQDHRRLMSLCERTIVSAERTPVAPRLNPASLLSVLKFHHAVFSDRPSPHETQRSLEGRRGLERLECLTTVLTDRKLFHQLTDVAKLRGWIQADLSDAALAPDARARFMLILPHCVDRSFAVSVLTNEVPTAYAKLATTQTSLPVAAALTMHFDSHLIEFLAIAASLYLTVPHSHSDEAPLNDCLGAWRKVFGVDTSHPGAPQSLYAFHLSTVFVRESELPAKEALHLIAHFLGSYANHDDSFTTRLSNCRSKINDGFADVAWEYMPADVLTVLIDIVRRVQDHFGKHSFTPQHLLALGEANKRWQGAKDGQDLAVLISEHFLSEEPRSRAATITELLAWIAPRLEYVCKQAIADYTNGSSDAVDIEISLEDGIGESTRILGNAEFLWRILSNLLRNAHEAFRKRRAFGMTDAALRIEVHVNASPPDRVAIEVRDNVPCQSGELEEFFVALGALSVHRMRLEKWDGRLDAQRLSEGLKCMRLSLRTVPVDEERELGDPDT
jgi:hypoxanthine-guanine phosphoribosyltransferase